MSFIHRWPLSTSSGVFFALNRECGAEWKQWECIGIEAEWKNGRSGCRLQLKMWYSKLLHGFIIAKEIELNTVIQLMGKNVKKISHTHQWEK